MRIVRHICFTLTVLLPGCLPKPAPSWLGPAPDAEPYGVFHEVEAGETLASICRAYKASLQEVAEINGLDDPNALRVGQKVFIPDVDPSQGQQRGVGAPGAEVRIEKKTGQFIWPVKGVLTSKFGLRHGRRHDGIDLGAPMGSPILAAAAGTVLYVGQQQGYGRLVILRHAGNMITVYAHNHKNLVEEGAQVAQGQQIAELGRSGRATGPHLHFEIRERTKPRNPLFFLPRTD